MALTLAIGWTMPVLGQGTTETQVPPASPEVAPAARQPSVPPAAEAPAVAPLTVTTDAPRAGATPQTPAEQKEIIIEPESPHTDRGEKSRVRLPPAGPGREAFLREFIRVDPRANSPFVGRESISAKEFYGRIGRTDLVAESDGQTRKRIWLMSAATLVMAGSVAGGLVVLGNAQNINDPHCLVNGVAGYNECVDRANQTTLIGGLIIGLGVVVGGGILTWALLTPEMVTPPEETVRLATEYNRNLAVRHRAPSGAQLQILPSIGPQGASLTARLTF